jgi:hypothetical protein
MDEVGTTLNGGPDSREGGRPATERGAPAGSVRADGQSLAPAPTRSNVRSASNVQVRDAAVPAHKDVRFRTHVRGRPALSSLLRSHYLGDPRKISELATQAEADGVLTSEQAADAKGLRHYCGRKDYKCVTLPGGRHRLVYITCRCCQSDEAQP